MLNKFAIFYIPNNNLSFEIYKFKKKFDSRYKNLDYVKHFPHLTFFTFESSKKFHDKKFFNNLDNYFKNLIKKKTNIDINKTNIFFNDILTNKDTIFFEIEKSKNLSKIQMKLYDFFKKSININNKINFSQNILNKNYNKFGCPYIGDIWIPHITICSIKDSKKKLMVKDFLDTKINFHANINNLSLWQITSKNRHKKIFETKL